MLGCIMNGNRICLVTEFCSNSDLLKYVKKLKSDAQFIAEKGIVHRDLAARNILIDCNKNAKITDFGLFIQLRDKSYVIPPRIREKLPIKWLAIESLKMYKFSLKTDIWTFAVVLYEMYSFGETPYENVEAEELLKYLEKGNRLSKPDFCSYEM
uniref:Protein kinase domain-containing protein n=1 Tax=Panagrolaimus davidi TaxID=227884 RepID=A0A914PT41_9BILA